MTEMEIMLRQDVDPDPEFYYRQQFKIYIEPYLLWDRSTWEAVLATGTVYRIEVDGRYAGNAILEGKRKGTRLIVDFGLLPEYRGKGIGKAALEQVTRMGKRFTAVTRKEVVDFFQKSGFILRRKVKNYYDLGVDGYYIIFEKDR